MTEVAEYLLLTLIAGFLVLAVLFRDPLSLVLCGLETALFVAWMRWEKRHGSR